MNPTEVKKTLDGIVGNSKEVWLAEDRTERVKAAPVSTIVKEMINRVLHLALKLHLAPRVLKAKTFYGTTVHAPIWTALPLKAKGFYSGEDLKLTKYIVDTVKPGDVFLDGGANYGWYSLLAEAMGAQVHAVEPTPKVLNLLAKNATGKNITTHRIALWSSEGEISFNDLGDGYDVINTILDPKRFGWKGKVKKYMVRTMTLDQMPRADIIKLDCEGAEYEILKSADTSLAHKPTLIIELSESARKDGTAREIVDLLAKKGYRSFYIASDFKLAPLAGKWDAPIVLNAVFKA